MVDGLVRPDRLRSRALRLDHDRGDVPLADADAAEPPGGMSEQLVAPFLSRDTVRRVFAALTNASMSTNASAECCGGPLTDKRKPPLRFRMPTFVLRDS